VLTSLKLQIQYYSFDGNLPLADEQNMLKLYLQPTLPFPLKNGKTLWVRPGVPYVFDQPIYDTSSRRLGSKSGLGDITLDLNYYVERPDAIAPEWMVSFNVAPVVENIFAKWFE
jgi:hypothetical protein